MPPMAEREMIMMIIDTLPVFYYEKMVGYMPASFADLVFVGERIGIGLRKGKFDYAASTNASSKRPGMNGAKKKEGEAHAVAVAPTWPNFPQAPYNLMYQYPPTSTTTQPTSILPHAQCPSDQEHPINHKDHP